MCSESDKAHIRLAAAKAILRLARKWDLHITPDIFRFTILIAKVSYGRIAFTLICYDIFFISTFCISIHIT